MDRDSILYKIRRKGQVIANRIFPDEFMSKVYSKIVLGKNVNLKKPTTFNEKIQWLKLNYYPNNSLFINCADKYKVREYIKEKKLEEIIVPLIGVWNKPEEIKWDELPNKFVLKCNHGCGYNIICDDKNNFDTHKAIKQLNKWLKEDFGSYNIEPHYSKIEPKIICEEYLGSRITDMKFFCFNGNPKFMYVSNNLIHDRDAEMGFFDLEGERIPLKREEYRDISNIVLPDYFNQMKEIAYILSEDFLFVRVDFFIANNKFYFAELTFTPGAGMMSLKPDIYDIKWGEMLDISDILNNY